jgi:hypothetical protein
MEPTQKDLVIARCAVCEAPRTVAIVADTWFFVGGPNACKHVCSRECLVKFVQSLPEQKPPVARLKYDGYHVIHPHRRE